MNRIVNNLIVHHIEYEYGDDEPIISYEFKGEWNPKTSTLSEFLIENGGLLDDH